MDANTVFWAILWLLIAANVFFCHLEWRQKIKPLFRPKDED